MSNSNDIQILDASCLVESVPYRTPLKFGGQVVDNALIANVQVIVSNRQGKEETGYGSMPLGNAWAWPSKTLTGEQTLALMQEFVEEVVLIGSRDPEYGHPISISYHLSGEYFHLGKKLSQNKGYDEPMPELAQLVSASPFDAALHDAYGKIHKQNCFNTLSKEYMKYDLSEYLDENFKGEYLDQYTLREPQSRLPLYHLIGAIDPITEADIDKRLDDGLPETLSEWIQADGLTHLKIKLAGDDLDWDINRVVTIDKEATIAQEARGCKEWFYSCDFNEKCENVDYVLEFLHRVKEESPLAYDRIQYIEQPTNRDLKSNPENKMHKAAELKPVVIDESLVDYDALLECRELGYSGVALKACKGQTDSLLLAAAAQKHDMFLCVQDLTCPGASFLHSASLAAHIPGVQAIEGNARQYCPAPNKRWSKLFPSMFDITDVSVGTEVLDLPGLGF